MTVTQQPIPISQNEVDAARREQISLGTPEPNTATSPRFAVTINDEFWPEAAYLTVSVSGFSMNTTFVIDVPYSKAGETEQGSGVKAGSKLYKLLRKQDNPVSRDKVKVYIGHTTLEHPTPDDLPLAVQGIITRVKINIGENTVSIEAEDDALILKEQYIHTQFRNTTTATVIAEIMQDYGFEAYIERTEQEVGTVYEKERITWEGNSTRGQNIWDVIQKFARFDGFKAFFWKGTFYYIPVETWIQKIRFRLGTNILDLNMEKNYSLTQGRINVEIASTDVKKKDSVITTIGGGHSGDITGESVSTRLVIPGIDPDTADFIASTLGLYLAQLERLISIECAGDLRQNPLNLLYLENTGTEFDERLYRIIQVQWTIGIDIGWHATINALNLPDSAIVRINRERFGERFTSRR